ncbi:MAG: DUF4405 domain-containing protein [Coriobacteriales bacterium]|jgi:hypothetical protein|nr:DUF4405 domain-containing protein [Coriobacteriales bacterium]
MRPSHTFVIDLVAAAVYVVAANPAVTGLALHEWLGLGVVVVFVVHCAAHYEGISNTVRRHADRASAANLVLDAVTLVVFMVVTVSGLMVSRHILPLLGLVAPGYFFWNPVHSISAKVLLALLLVHVVVHWRWIRSMFARRKSSVDSSHTC